MDDTPVHDHAAMLAAQAADSGAATPGPAPASGGFFSDFFEVFTPRQVCMNYEPDVVWMHVLSDATIALAYFSIPLALIYFVRRRRDLAFNWMFVLFASFILACGTTHVFGIIAIWKPYYRLDGAVKSVTGLISIATAVLLWPLVNKALHLPSPNQLRLANERLEAEVVERLRAETDARRISEDLDKRVQERTAQLNAAVEQRSALLNSERAARAEAEHASRIKDDFVATLSHELRTPISSIFGWTHLLRENPRRPDAGYGLEVIERNTRVQARMIDDLLDVSRIVAGKLRLDVQSVDLATVIDAALETLKPAADAKGVRLIAVIDRVAGGVRGDAARLQQIVSNLLSNAIKFTPRSGRVQITLQRINSHTEIIVEDTGRGIKPGFLPHVFDRFRQEDPSTTRSHGGLGIGLSIVKHLVELHGGTVTARSQGEGAGSIFTVALPLAALTPDDAGPNHRHPTQPGNGPTTPLPPPTSLKGVRILVVDDEADTRNLVERLLTEAGAAVITAPSAAQAMEIILRDPAAAPLNLLISDIGMPDEDGYTFLRKVRQLEGGRGGGSPTRLPAIALTAFARSEDRTRALVAGFQAHIAKPAEPVELIATVASLTGRIESR